MKTTRKWSKGFGRNLFLAGMAVLMCAIGLVVAGCDDGNGNGDSGGGDDLPVKTIAWQSDGNGFTQYYTNDSTKLGYLIPALGTANHSGNTYEIECKMMSGSDYTLYGLLFSVTASGDKFYGVGISYDGWYYVLKVDGGLSTIQTWTEVPAGGNFQSGYNKTNSIKVEQSGNQYTVKINNFQVHQFTDASITGPKDGVFVSIADATRESFPNTPVDVRFKKIQ